jgi:hypothetical protein
VLSDFFGYLLLCWVWKIEFSFEYNSNKPFLRRKDKLSASSAPLEYTGHARDRLGGLVGVVV